MIPFTSTSTGTYLNGFDTIGSSTDQTPMNNADNTSNVSESNQQFGRKPGSIKHLFDKIRELKSIDNLDFGDRLELSDIIHEAWTCGFKDRI